jgi:hypothetical protein
MMPRRRRSVRWWLVSLAVHGALAVLLANMVFRYPLGQATGFAPRKIVPERIQYIIVPAAPPEASGGAPREDSGGSPAPLSTPTEVPATIPPPVDTAASQAAGATGEGGGGDGPGTATGLVPANPDPRIALTPGAIARVPRSVAQDVDSIVNLAIGIYVDSMQIAAGQRKPGDWSVRGKDGQVWGWDHSGIRLGKFTIPNALLALLPLNMTSAQSPIDARNSAYVRREIMENAQRSISEDEFKAAIKRIRERKDRERRDRMLASAPDSSSR